MALAELERRIGYTFQTADLIEQALTHSSVRHGRAGAASDNERLEFVGDRVLGLAMAELVAEIDSKAREGALARRYNALVNGKTCARVARAVGLGSLIVLAQSEVGSGGRDKDTILADALEAMLAAIFLEAGFDTARRVIRSLWAEEIGRAPTTAVDPKSALQEWAQGRGLELPRYALVRRAGPDHAPVFECEVTIEALDPAHGSGASKREAEQAAATAFLARVKGTVSDAVTLDGATRPLEPAKHSE